MKRSICSSLSLLVASAAFAGSQEQPMKAGWSSLKQQQQQEGPKPTLEEQLNQARADLTTAQGQVTAITAERDTANGKVTAITAERDTLQRQFDSLSTTANETKTQLTAAQGQVTSLTAERDGIRTSLDTANTNISRLEKLCGVKGVDPKSSVPAIEEPAAEVSEAQWIERYNAAKTPQDKAKIVDAMEEAARVRKAKKA